MSKFEWLVIAVFVFVIVMLLTGCGRSSHTVVVRDKTEGLVAKTNCGWDYYMNCFACDYHYENGSVVSRCSD